MIGKVNCIDFISLLCLVRNLIYNSYIAYCNMDLVGCHYPYKCCS